jgi:hypothetical protein
LDNGCLKPTSSWRHQKLFSLVQDEDIRSACLTFLRSTTRPTPQKFQTFVNATILSEEASRNNWDPSWALKHAISLRTATRWMHTLNFNKVEAHHILVSTSF